MNGKSHYSADSSTNREPDTFDNETGKLDLSPPKVRRIKLSHPRGMRAEMGRLYRLCDKGELNSSEMNRRIWALDVMVKAYAVQELAERMANIEARQLEQLASRQALPEAV